MSKFLDIVFTSPVNRQDKGVFYIQKQNSNLTDEFSALMRDVDPDIPWGTAAFGWWFSALRNIEFVRIIIQSLIDLLSLSLKFKVCKHFWVNLAPTLFLSLVVIEI